MKLRLLAAALATFALSAGAAIAQTTPAKPAATPARPATTQARPATTATKPATKPATTVSDRAALSYAIGYQMARDLAERKVDLELANLVKGVQDGHAKKEPSMPAERLGAALQQFTAKMAEEERKERAEFDRIGRENKTAADAFLATNRAKPGVTVLPSGVQYRVIEAGSGPKPTANSTVTLHLRGSMINGQEFASTYRGDAKAPSFKVSELPLPGMKDAVMMMPVGSRWELFIPADQAYGNSPRSPVGPGNAVIFDVKLVSMQ